MATNLFGWDLLYASVKEDIESNQDVLVCFTHLVLISNGFKCIGLGDSKNLDGTEKKSELLPKGWNKSYALRYVHQGRLYNLRGTNMDDAIMINLIRVQERTVSMVQLNVKAVAERTGTLEKMLPNSDELAETIKKQLIDKIIISTKYKDTPSQTTDVSTPQSSTFDYLPPQPDSNFGPQRSDPRGLGIGVGRSDLDPFGGFGRLPSMRPSIPGPLGGGGMLFVPPRDPTHTPSRPNFGIAPGSVPPGARFDPFRPPDSDPVPRRPNRPNSDFPPPGFDDMYM